MLHLVTGTPGAGKTLLTLDTLRKVTDRPIYYVGIPDLTLPWIKIDDPFNYHLELPDNAILVFDEVQKYFPVRSPKQPVPDAMSFIETHRHKGIDLYFITQHPNLLDHHARRLVGEHIHLQRNFGMKRVVKYTNNKLFDYNNYHELKSCEKNLYRYPKEVFSLYKSAEVHTVKSRIPGKLLLIPLLLGVVAVCIVIAYNVLFSDNPANHLQANNASTVVTVPNDSQEWEKAFVPAIEGVPYTAPFYRKIAQPKVMPIVSGCVANKKKCSCYTQQGTLVTMTQELCRVVIRRPQFNPFIESKPKETKRVFESEARPSA